MTLNTKLLKELREQAAGLGVALALPEYTNQVDPQSQNHILYAASSELIHIAHERNDGSIDKVAAIAGFARHGIWSWNK